MKLRRLHPRGAAATELAIAIVVIVPIAFYALFLQDLLLYRLNQQEAITTAPWDFLIVNYQKERFSSGMVGSVASANRRKFCDHTSAYDSYDLSYDCSGREAVAHHAAALAAHECWVSSSAAEQLTCGVDKGYGVFGEENRRWASTFATGGLSTCTARLAAFNKFLPMYFFNMGGGGWSQVKLIEKKTFGDKYGGYSGAIGQTHRVDDPDLITSNQRIQDRDNFHFERDYFALVHDPWAVNDKNLGQLKPSHEGSHPLFDRGVGDDSFWGQRDDEYANPSREYLERARGVFGEGMNTNNKGDHVPSAPMSWGRREASGWSDVRQREHAGDFGPIFGQGMR